MAQDTWEERLRQERQTWLREEIVKLEGMWKDPSKGRFSADEAWLEGINQALRLIINRYQSELDQPISK